MNRVLAMVSLCWLANGAWGQAPLPPTTEQPKAQAFELQITAVAELRELLDQHLELQRYRQLEDLSDSELDRLIDSSQNNAAELLATLGYFSADIRVERRRNPGAHRVVHVSVQEGPAAKVADVRLRFSGAIADDPEAADLRNKITRTWALPVGSRFTQEGWNDAKRKALRELTRQRYPGGQIEHSLADVDPREGAVVLEVTLGSGALYRWGTIAVIGLQRYDPVLTERLARLPKGSPYDLDTLIGAQRRLTESGYFDSAYINLDMDSAPQAALARIRVQETPLKRIKLGIGASTDSGVRLSAEHTHMMMPVLGWQANSTLALDEVSRSIRVALLSQPGNEDWRMSALAEIKNEEAGSFEVGSQRFRGGFTKKTERIDRSYFLQYDRADSVASDTISRINSQAVTANFGITLRRFDTLPFPSSGWGLSAELGGGSTLGNRRVPFTRALGRWQSIWSLGELQKDGQSLARASRVSLLAELGGVIPREDVRLPATLLFLAGGGKSVRGYSLNSIGVSSEEGQVSPGRYLATASLEWQRPWLIDGQPSDWESTLFLDTGTVSNSPTDLRLKTGLGAGVRWKTPIGPLQMDLAYGLDARRLRLHLNLGFNF